MSQSYEGDVGFAARKAFFLQEEGAQMLADQLAENTFQDDPRNGFAAHTRAHILMSNLRYLEAYEFLSAWLKIAHLDTYLYSHLQWHRAICLIQMGRLREASDLYRRIKSRKSGAPLHLDLADDVGFLWRMKIAGHDANPSWLTETSAILKKLESKTTAFILMHHLLARVVEGDPEIERSIARVKDRLVQDDEALTQLVQKIGAAAFAFQEGRYSTSLIHFDEFDPRQIEGVGGSNVERHLIFEIYVECLLRADRFAEALRLLGTESEECSATVRNQQRRRAFTGLGRLSEAAAMAQKIRIFEIELSPLEVPSLKQAENFSASARALKKSA